MPSTPIGAAPPEPGASARPVRVPLRAGLPGGALGRRVGAGLPATFWWQFGGTLVNRLGNFIRPFLVLYLTTQRGLSIPAAGAVLTLYGAGSIMSQPIGGWLADRIGRRATLVGSLLSAATSVTLLGLSRSVPLVVATTALCGLTAELYRPASQALVADVVRPQDRTKAYALLFWAVNLGYAVSTSAAGLLADRGWWLLFVIDAGTTAVFALLLLRGTRGLRRPTVVLADGLRPGRTTDVLRDRLLLAIMALTVVYATIYQQASFTLPLAVHDAHLATSVFGLIIALNGLIIVVLQPLTLPLLQRLPRYRVLAASVVLVGLGFGLTAFCRTPWQFALTVVVWTVGEIGTAGTMTAIVTDIAPVHLRGRYLGIAGLSWGMSALLAPLIGSAVYARIGPGWLWAGCAAVGLLCGLGQLLIGPYVGRRRRVETP